MRQDQSLANVSLYSYLTTAYVRQDHISKIESIYAFAYYCLREARPNIRRPNKKPITYYCLREARPLFDIDKVLEKTYYCLREARPDQF